MGANAEEKLAPFNYAYVPYNIAIAGSNRRHTVSGFKIWQLNIMPWVRIKLDKIV